MKTWLMKVGVIIGLGLVLILVYLLYTARQTRQNLEKIVGDQVVALDQAGAAKAEMVSPENLAKQVAESFQAGKDLAKQSVVVHTVTKWRTETVTVPLEGKCPSDISLEAAGSSATLETISGQPWMLGSVRVHAWDTATHFDKTVDLSLDPTKVSYQISQPVLTPAGKELVYLPVTDGKYHRGKAVSCGLGVTAAITAWPSASGGLGAGVFCGVSWGFVKVAR